MYKYDDGLGWVSKITNWVGFGLGFVNWTQEHVCGLHLMSYISI